MTASSMSFQVSVTSRVLRDYAGFVRAALTLGGQQYRSEMASYPPQSSGSSYRRTGGLGNRATFRVEGPTLQVGGPMQGVYCLFGTGVHGPSGTPIVPRTKPMLAWKGTGSGGREGGWIFAKSVQGFIWEGKLEAVKSAIELGIRTGFKVVR